ncbi:unnamed protein product [Pipistrellus nathusii]|uniref:Uncharacterized protein n=1 Tax=Pipistrellus nathusii TaxID=59473 RepID=A0ABN9ZMJ0_PIPNA
MTSILSALLCLGLSLDPRTHVKAGTLPKPTLWAESGPVIPFGNPVTLWCRGNLKAQEYRLYADGSFQHLDTQKSLESGDPAKFLIKENYAHRYTCTYLSHTSWSGHSDPLQLVVTGSSEGPSPPPTRPPSTAGGPEDRSLPPTESGTQTGPKWNMNILIGVSVALVLVLSLLLFYLRHRCQSKGRNTDRPYESAGVQRGAHVQPPAGDHKPRGHGQIICSPAADTQQEPLSYASVKDLQPGESMELDPQAAPPYGLQDVTYVQLNLLALRQQTSASLSSSSEEPPEEPSLYAALAFH